MYLLVNLLIKLSMLWGA